MPVIDDIEALKNAEQALRESEIRMRALLDASRDEILLVSTDGTVLPSTERLEQDWRSVSPTAIRSARASISFFPKTWPSRG